ncbi:hypothetical protein COW53_02265, partial [bacterium CG17_big_fil_post_rev_8_21_14_2_50_64_8]
MGGVDAEFSQGMRVFDGDNIKLLDSQFEENQQQLMLISGLGFEVGRNAFTCVSCTSIGLSEDIANGEIFANTIIVPSLTNVESLGINLDGMVGEAGVIPIHGMSIHDNRIEAALGVWFSRTGDNDLFQNDIHAN